VKHSPRMPAALVALLIAAAALAVRIQAAPAAAPAPAAEAPAPQGPGIAVSSPENRLELRLPAGYWEALTPQQIAQHMQGGCTQGQVPADLVFVVQDRDALAQVVITRSARSFLMRDKSDLETFENGFMQAVQGRIGGGADDVESSYEERDGMIVHRFGLTAAPSAGGGCAMGPQQSAPPQKLRFVFVDYFLRPQGEDALYYRASARAPVDVYEELKPEFESILASVRFRGKLADQFFDPQAPEDKVPTAKQAAKDLSSRNPLSGWMLAVGLMMIIWLMLRRRRQQQQA
jgi:hypothetical protein